MSVIPPAEVVTPTSPPPSSPVDDLDELAPPAYTPEPEPLAAPKSPTPPLIQPSASTLSAIMNEVSMRVEAGTEYDESEDEEEGEDEAASIADSDDSQISVMTEGR